MCTDTGHSRCMQLQEGDFVMGLLADLLSRGGPGLPQALLKFGMQGECGLFCTAPFTMLSLTASVHVCMRNHYISLLLLGYVSSAGSWPGIS